MSEKKTKYEQDLENVETFSHIKLKDYYERICNVYTQRLCDMYDWNPKDCWWIADIVGETFCAQAGEYSLDMSEIRMLVDNAVPYEVYAEYWSHNYAMYNAKMMDKDNEFNFYMINLYSWLRGAPHYSKELVDKLDDLYWKIGVEENFPEEKIKSSLREIYNEHIRNTEAVPAQ